LSCGHLRGMSGRRSDWLMPTALCYVVSVLVQPHVRMATWTFQSLDLCPAPSPVSEPAARLLHSRTAVMCTVGIEAT